MKNDPFEIAEKYQKRPKPDENLSPSPRVGVVDLTEGRIIAVEICSNVLQAHIWLAFDDSFNPGDGQAVFYADELPFLATKDAETLREIHKVKLAFGPGSRVRQ
jgi:hypothetical protein